MADIRRFLHKKSQVHARNLYREALVNLRRLPSTTRHPPLPQRPPQHPLRRRPLPHSPWPTVHRKTPYRNSLSRLCATPQVRTIAVPMQATQARGLRPNGHNLPTTERPPPVPRPSASASWASSLDRPKYPNTAYLRISQCGKIEFLEERYKSRC